MSWEGWECGWCWLWAVIPPEEFEPLPSENVAFDIGNLDSFASWSRAHLALGTTVVRETGLLTGARFGRVALEAYQLAPALRLLAKPRPALLVADDVGLGKTIEAGLAMLELNRQILKRDGEGWKPAFLGRTVEPIPVRVDDEAAKLFELISAYCSRAEKDAAGEEDAELVSFAMQIVRKRAASSLLALGRPLAHRLGALRKESEREEPPERSELRQCHGLRPIPAPHAERGAGRILRWSSARERKRRGCRGWVPPARCRPPRATGGCTGAGRPVPIIPTVEP